MSQCNAAQDYSSSKHELKTAFLSVITMNVVLFLDVNANKMNTISIKCNLFLNKMPCMHIKIGQSLKNK